MNVQAKINIGHSVCPHDCPSTCALDVELLPDGRIGRVHGADDPRLAAGHHAWAEHHRRAGRFEDAAAAELRAIAVTQAAYGRDDARLVPLLRGLAGALESGGATAEAAARRARADALAKAGQVPTGGAP